MKIIYLILILLCFISCYEVDKAIDKSQGFKTWNVELKNNLGELKIDLPSHLDTVFEWTQYSDCGDACAYFNYRIQPKSLPLYNETGFVIIQPTDSVEQFTLKQPKVKSSNSIVNEEYRKLIDDFVIVKRLEAEENHLANTFKDKFLRVGNGIFYVYSYHGFNYETAVNIGKIEAVLLISGNPVSLVFEYRKSGSSETKFDFKERYFNAMKALHLSYSR